MNEKKSELSNNSTSDISMSAKKIQQPAKILSLKALYESKKPSPQKFLSNIDKSNFNAFAREEQKFIIDNIGKIDPNLSTTIGLLHKSRTHLHGKFSHSCAMFAEKLIRSEAKKLGVKLPDESATSHEILKSIHRMVKDHLSDDGVNKKGLNLIVIGALWLNRTKLLDFKEALNQIQKTALESTNNEIGQIEIGNIALEILTKPPVTPANLKKLISFSDAWNIETERAKSEARSATSALSSARSELDELKSQILNLENRLDDAQIELKQEKIKFNEEIQQHHGDRINVQHDLGGVRSRLQATLSRKIKSAVDIALEAVELDPPRIGVVKQELNSVIEIIEGEIDWLKSSD
jgi:hypothetical protein